MLGLGGNASCNPLDIDHVGVKAPMFSFGRLHGADPLPGVEMASTGEVGCIASTVHEALLLSLVGGLLGVLAGVGGAWLFGQLAGMPTVIVPNSIILAFASAAAVGIFFGFYPANQAAQLDPIEALRHE